MDEKDIKDFGISFNRKQREKSKEEKATKEFVEDIDKFMENL